MQQSGIVPTPVGLFSTLVVLAFAFGLAAQACAAVVVEYDEQGQCVHVSEDGVPVLRYHHGVTEVPEGVDKVFERGDYVSALYGLEGELLTGDFPSDHVHHRAVNWSWATVKWKDDARDMFAVRNPYTGPVTGGLWARPTRMMRAEDGPCAEGDPVGGVIEAESEWKWDDEAAIVREHVLIRIHPKEDHGRLVDFEMRLTPLVDELEFCGRIEAGYSG
ncbi:MAG: hypothetical protein GY851_22440, partial [bacterium]|nr:hypothetical protein [bacterium]